MNEIELVKPEFVGELKAEIKGLGVIEHNISNAKEYALKQRDYFSKIIYDEEQIRLAKDDRATVNRMSSKIADYRKDIIKAFKKPIEDFETIAKETEKIFKETSEIIDTQVKIFEDRDWLQKKAIIEDFIDDNTFVVWDTRWKNKTYLLEDIFKDITLQVAMYEPVDPFACVELEEVDTFTGEKLLSRTFTGNKSQIDLLIIYAKSIGIN